MERALQAAELTIAGKKLTTAREGKTGRASQEALPLFYPDIDLKNRANRRWL